MSAILIIGLREIQRLIRGFTMRKLTIAGLALATALTAGCATSDDAGMMDANATANSAEQTAENAMNTANSAASSARSAKQTAEQALAAAKAAQRSADEANERAKRMLEQSSMK
jgi:methyl-accepting chemotaxis protein